MKKVALQLDMVTPSDLHAFYQQYQVGPARKKLSVQVFGGEHTPPFPDTMKSGIIELLPTFRRSMPLYPLPNGPMASSL